MSLVMRNTDPKHYAGLSAAEVLARQSMLLAQWALEDAARIARNAAILASL